MLVGESVAEAVGEIKWGPPRHNNVIRGPV